jgi:hypothetical protein
MRDYQQAQLDTLIRHLSETGPVAVTMPPHCGKAEAFDAAANPTVTVISTGDN